MRKAVIGVAAAACAVLALGAFAVVAVLMILLGPSSSAQADRPGHVAGVSPVLLQAYYQAVQQAPQVAPQCQGLRWQVLAGIAQIESGNAAGRTVTTDGRVEPPIIGPRLDGSGAGGNTTPIKDTDNGLWDGDVHYDAAVGVLQFIPGSWRVYGRDGNGDGIHDPHNVFDNAVGAVVHLCGATARNLADDQQLRDALYGYNRSWSYVDRVIAAISTFDATPPADADLAGGSGTGKIIVAAAMKKVGTPYSWGGGNAKGPSRGICCSPGGSDGSKIVGLDCSGLTTYAAAQAGFSLPRTSPAQASLAQQIPRSAGLKALLPGDLVFFGFVPELRSGIHHVGIYVGGGQMVNSPRPGEHVRVEPVWMDQYAGAVRLTRS